MTQSEIVFPVSEKTVKYRTGNGAEHIRLSTSVERMNYDYGYYTTILRLTLVQ